MAQYKIRGADELCYCPYDNTHVMPVKRYPYHIIKCRKNHPNANMAVCPFNARHEMPVALLRHHISRCPDSAMVHQDMLKSETTETEGEYFHGDCSVPPYSKSDDLPNLEDWDHECDMMNMERRREMEADETDYHRQQALLRLPCDPAATSAPPPLINSVFNYSLSMSGLGRGRPPPGGSTTAPRADENAALLQTLARGRGMGGGATGAPAASPVPTVGLVRQPAPMPAVVRGVAPARQAAPVFRPRGTRGGVCGSSAFRLAG